ncbi:hypothetical protein HPB52_022366 [Rhipicephalus sanguineus]|uniref:Uncharacterized protein n=1 Tax=Rhipicephalus sanguineus TaxID=34632 RepID=A0A9D4Q7W8_RHISA|nr:hypothetical protein HPB52_022366 [Rhipicephalus sanguineus]
MHADFQEGVESISLTNDMWTSRYNQSYISLTCHYLTSNFEMRSFALENRSVTESHTACNILEHLQAMMDNWELPLQKLKEAICLELATSETTVPNLARQEWKAVAGLVKALESIASATKGLSGHKYATLSSVVPFLCGNGTQMVLKDCIAADDDTSEFARNLLKSMRTRFAGQDEQKEYVLATACDPRFKNLFCTETFQETRLLELARTELQLPPEEESSDCVEASTSTAHKERVSGIWDSIEKLAASSERRHCTETANIKEFKRDTGIGANLCGPPISVAQGNTTM